MLSQRQFDQHPSSAKMLSPAKNCLSCLRCRRRVFGNLILVYEQNHSKPITIPIPSHEQDLPRKRFRSSNYCCGKPWLLFCSFFPIRVIQISDGTGISHRPRHARKTKVMWLPLTSPDTITPRSLPVAYLGMLNLIHVEGSGRARHFNHVTYLGNGTMDEHPVTR